MTSLQFVHSTREFCATGTRIFTRTVAWLKTPRGKAMLVGLLYLSATVVLLVTITLMGEIIDEANAQKTGNNVLLLSAQFHWLSLTTLFGAGATVGVVAMLHELLRPANARISRIATAFGLVAAVIQALGLLFLAGVDDLLREHRYKLAFVSYDYNALGDVGMMLFRITVVIAIFFLGIYGIFVGYLIFKSRYLPRKLGAMVGVSASAWLIAYLPFMTEENTLAALMLAGFLGPSALSGWLMFKGVNLDQWTALTAPEGWDDDPPSRRTDGPSIESMTSPSDNITGRPKLVS